MYKIFCLGLVTGFIGLSYAAGTVSATVGVSATLVSQPMVAETQPLLFGSLFVSGITGSRDSCTQDAAGGILCIGQASYVTSGTSQHSCIQNAGGGIRCTGQNSYTPSGVSQLAKVTLTNNGVGSISVSSITASDATAVVNSNTFTMHLNDSGSSCIGTLSPGSSCVQNLAGQLVMPVNYNFNTNPVGSLPFNNSTITVTYSG